MCKFGEVAAALSAGVTTAPLAGLGMEEEAEPALAEETANDGDLRIAPRSLSSSPDARLKLWGDGDMEL